MKSVFSSSRREALVDEHRNPPLHSSFGSPSSPKRAALFENSPPPSFESQDGSCLPPFFLRESSHTTAMPSSSSAHRRINEVLCSLDRQIDLWNQCVGLSVDEDRRALKSTNQLQNKRIQELEKELLSLRRAYRVEIQDAQSGQGTRSSHVPFAIEQEPLRHPEGERHSFVSHSGFTGARGAMSHIDMRSDPLNNAGSSHQAEKSVSPRALSTASSCAPPTLGKAEPKLEIEAEPVPPVHRQKLSPSIVSHRSSSLSQLSSNTVVRKRMPVGLD